MNLALGGLPTPNFNWVRLASSVLRRSGDGDFSLLVQVPPGGLRGCFQPGGFSISTLRLSTG